MAKCSLDIGVKVADLDRLPTDETELRSFVIDKIGEEIFKEIRMYRQIQRSGGVDVVRDIPNLELANRGLEIS